MDQSKVFAAVRWGFERRTGAKLPVNLPVSSEFRGRPVRIGLGPQPATRTHFSLAAALRKSLRHFRQLTPVTGQFGSCKSSVFLALNGLIPPFLSGPQFGTYACRCSAARKRPRMPAHLAAGRQIIADDV